VACGKEKVDDERSTDGRRLSHTELPPSLVGLNRSAPGVQTNVGSGPRR